MEFGLVLRWTVGAEESLSDPKGRMRKRVYVKRRFRLNLNWKS